MLDRLELKRKGAGPLYRQIVRAIAREIQEGSLLPGTRLPSIREFARLYQVSKITVENAYQILEAEGYLESYSRSGYQVAARPPEARHELPRARDPVPSPPPSLYDLESYSVDPRYVDHGNWKRLINEVLRDRSRLYRYGDSQGEEELRLGISHYIREYRGVQGEPHELLIGAGTQSLLSLLIPLLEGKPQRVLFPKEGFRPAEALFRNYGYQVQTYGSLLEEGHQDALAYLRPGESGLSTARERLAFLEEGRRRNLLFLEDDYNGEFRWGTRPLPALRSLDPTGETLYLGSFSGVLMPSVRISYLLLSPSLLPALPETLQAFNQTASTLEQLALASFIRQGFLAKQVRRMRKSYARKSALLEEGLRSCFPQSHILLEKASTLETRVRFLFPASLEAARKKGVALKATPVPGEYLLVFGGLAEEKILPALEALKEAWT